MKKAFVLFTGAVVATTLGGFSQAADLLSGVPNLHKPQILYGEPLTTLKIPDLPSASEGVGALSSETGGTVTVTFQALGKSFELILESNDHLYSELSRAQKQRLRGKTRLFRGQIAGIPGSWVRLAQVGHNVSGMLWDGTEAYLIDPSDHIAPALAEDIRPKVKRNLIYRLADVAWNDARCASDPNQAPVTDYRGLVSELQALSTALPAVSRELSVAVVADTQFVQSYSADPEAAVMAQMNIVDGIYSEQLGVHIKVSQIRSLQSNGNLTATDASSLLTQFGTYVTSPGFTNPGLAHLFTGRTLNSNVLGIAYIASVCKANTGIGVSHVGGSGTMGALTVAHEIGHNFGAYHDNQSGSPCASTAGTYLMNPILNGSDQFSGCSLTSIQPILNAATCLAPVSTTPSADIRVNLPVSAITAPVGQAFQYRVEIANGGSAVATASSATIAIPSGINLQSIAAPSGVTCTPATGQASCNLGDLPAATTRTITLTLLGNSAGQYTSRVNVTASNDSNTANNSAQAVFNIGAGGPTSFEAHFDSGTDGFQYVDNAFRGATQSAYASGIRDSIRGFSGGGLVVKLGAIDNNTVLNMSGGWRRSFTLAAALRVKLSFRVQLRQTANYESDELSQAMFALDGRALGLNGSDYLIQIRGDGNGGSTLTSGWRSFTVDLGVLGAGTHTLTIGGYNNKKTYSDEGTDILIDDVVLTTQ